MIATHFSGGLQEESRLPWLIKDSDGLGMMLDAHQLYTSMIMSMKQSQRRLAIDSETYKKWSLHSKNLYQYVVILLFLDQPHRSKHVIRVLKNPIETEILRAHVPEKVCVTVLYCTVDDHMYNMLQ